MGIKEKQELTLSERIELEEKDIRKANITSLENFLTKAVNESITVDFMGIRFFNELSWTYSRCRKFIILSDLDENMILGTLDIPVDDIMSCGSQMFCMDEDVLEIELYNGIIITLSVD